MELELRNDDVVGRVFYYGKGCDVCNNTGYKGRQGLYEIMMLDDEMRDMIVKHASTQVLRAEAKKTGNAHAASVRLDGYLRRRDHDRRSGARDNHGRVIRFVDLGHTALWQDVSVYSRTVHQDRCQSFREPHRSRRGQMQVVCKIRIIHPRAGIDESTMPINN